MFIRALDLLLSTVVVGLFLSQPSYAAATLALGSSSGAPGTTVTVPISYTSNGAQSAALMWTLSYSATDFSAITIGEGSATSGAGKSIQCASQGAGRYTCVASGLNTNVISDGTIAMAALTVASNTTSASSAVQLVNTLGADDSAAEVPVSGVGATIGLGPQITPSALSCNPGSLPTSGSSQCTVTISPAAPSGGFAVALGYVATGPTVSMPSSVTVPAGATAAAFTASVSNATTPSSVQISATANSATKTFALAVGPAVSVAVSPTTATISAGQSQQFTATVTGASNTSVTWSLSPAVGSVSATGLYTAPTTVSAQQTVTLRATSAADTTKSATATVTVNPPPTGGPLISSVKTSAVMGTAATITWKTDVASNSRVDYGTSASSLTMSASNTSLVTSHTITLNGLKGSTKYYYRVTSADASGRTTVSPDTVNAPLSFTTQTAPVAAYGFNERSGSIVNDASGHNVAGTILGATWTTAGKYGSALSFNGTSSYVDLGNPAVLQLTGAMTIEAWVYAAANPAADGQIVAKSDGIGWQFKTTPDTGVQTFGLGVSPNSGSLTQRYGKTTRALKTWYHVAGVYNAGSKTMTLYLNGVANNKTLVGSIPASQFNNPNVNVNIGRRTGGFYFNGIIDEIRIYNRALSQAEIKYDMNTPLQ